MSAVASRRPEAAANRSGEVKWVAAENKAGLSSGSGLPKTSVRTRQKNNVPAQPCQTSWKEQVIEQNKRPGNPALRLV